MPFEIRDDVFIKKADKPLILENYEQVTSISISPKLKREYKYWESYQSYLKEFLRLHEELRNLLLDKRRPTQRVWDEYQEVKANLITAQEIINSDYEQYSE